MNKTLYRTLAVALVSLFMAGCANNLTVGEAIQSESAELAEIGATWSKGDELVQEGRSDIEEGRDLVAEGRELIKEGENKVAKGEAQREKAERAYRERTGRVLPDLE